MTLRLPILLITLLLLPMATRAEVPFRVIHLHGTPEQIGAEHARELAEPINELHERYLMAWFKENPAARPVAMLAAAAFEPHLLPEHRAEVRSLAEASGLELPASLLAQCFLDLLPMMGCSTIALPADAAPDGIARFGRNLDFPSMGVADQHSVLLMYEPEARYRFAAVGWPGMIGVLSGMNEHGLTLANMEVRRPRRLPTAMPYILLYRSVLEQCRNVDEAIELLERTPRQSANTLMLMDAEGNRAVIEITPERITVRRGEAGAALMSTNHHRGADHLTPGRCWRYDSLCSSAGELSGNIGVKEVKQMLRDVGQGDMTMQAMIFEPSQRVIHLAAGARAHELPYHTIDLKQFWNE